MGKVYQVCGGWRQFGVPNADPECGEGIMNKLECANHSCKCYRTGLEKLVQEKSSYKDRGGLIQKCAADTPVLLAVP